MDWRLNPGGLFRGADGTDWDVVMQTWSSWFFPTAVLGLAVCIPVVIWRFRRA